MIIRLAPSMSQSGLEMKFLPNSFHLSGSVNAITFFVLAQDDKERDGIHKPRKVK